MTEKESHREPAYGGRGDLRWSLEATEGSEAIPWFYAKNNGIASALRAFAMTAHPDD
jgi:hypothetical protein